MESLKRNAALNRVTSMALGAHESALLVRGEPGIGKSHLLDSATSELEMTTVIIRINPAEREFALSGISTILAGLRREGVTEFGGRFTLRSDDPDQMFAAAHDLIGLIQGFKLPPTLLMVDDIDLTDAQSLAIIGVLASRLAGTGLRLVLTASSLPVGSPLAAIPAIRLSALRLPERRGHGASFPGDAHGSTQPHNARLCGGNARILVESLRLIDPEQLTGAMWLMLPPRFNHALSSIAGPQLDSLTEEQLDILAYASLAPLWHVG
ncbi:MAG: ATP-binding protein, partial [Aeromicrobium sp.]